MIRNEMQVCSIIDMGSGIDDCRLMIGGAKQGTCRMRECLASDECLSEALILLNEGMNECPDEIVLLNFTG
jgi:hypothetical protein